MNNIIIDPPVHFRSKYGEAYMYCETCMAKLYSFDGEEDNSRPCPYLKNGKCIHPDEE